MPLLECVPNFSEGRDAAKIAAIAAAIRSVAGAHLLHIDTSPAAHRTVMTIAGEPEAVTEAAFAGIKAAAEVIDMTQQAGVHPRIGATDVCPLIPLKGLTMEEADAYANQLAKRVGEEAGIPVYLYEHSQKDAHRRALPDIRKGQYEGFAEKMRLPGWAPDYGPRTFTPKTGATVIGARDLLVAFNIALAGDDVEAAARIAAKMRSRGYRDERGEQVPGLLPKIRAIGWYMADYSAAQVSLNLLDYRITSPLQAYEACRELAAEEGLDIIGSELIGLMPEECLLEAGSFALLRKGQEVLQDKSLLVHEGVMHLGLNQLKAFEPGGQVLEWVLESAGL